MIPTGKCRNCKEEKPLVAASTLSVEPLVEYPRIRAVGVTGRLCEECAAGAVEAIEELAEERDP